MSVGGRVLLSLAVCAWTPQCVVECGCCKRVLPVLRNGPGGDTNTLARMVVVLKLPDGICQHAAHALC